MPADLATEAPLQNDGSIDDAIISMPDLLADDPRDVDPATGYPRPQDRDVDGTFKGKDAKVEEPKVEAKPDEVKDPAAAAEDDESDYIELPPEKDGDAPVRHKLDDVVQGWQKSKDLEAQLVEARKVQPSQPLPHEVEQHVTGLQQERTKLVDQAKIWLQLNQPRAPNLDLVNPASPNYNPEAYHGQVQNYQRQLADYRDVTKSIEAADAKTKSEQEAIRASRVARESAELQKIWPEVLNDDKVRTETKKALFDHFGIDDALLDSDVTMDHRFYALAKDALAYRASIAQKAEAVKAVKVKPKLIQAQARQAPSNSKSAKFSDAYSKAAQSGSLEDAADALAGFLV